MSLEKELELDTIIATLEQENFQLRARNQRLEREKHTCANEDQLFTMWKASEGHMVRFARMLESFHGIGEILDAAS